MVQAEAAVHTRQLLLFSHNPLNGAIFTEACVSMSLSFKKMRVIVSRRWMSDIWFQRQFNDLELDSVFSPMYGFFSCLFPKYIYIYRGSLAVKVSLEQWIKKFGNSIGKEHLLQGFCNSYIPLHRKVA